MDKVDDIFEDLRDQFNETSDENAVNEAVAALKYHFMSRGSDLPFEFDPVTREISARDPEFISFVARMSEIRTFPRASREFEVEVARRLSLKLTGPVHRVGWPRTIKQRRREFVEHLKVLGFGSSVLMGREKDAGLDVLWLPPIGGGPHRLVVSVQCKNSWFNIGDADKSLGPTTRSLGCHLGLQPSVHVCCVLFNDYVETTSLGRKPMNFVPLGLSDLASVDNAAAPVML